ncbi:toxin glutamine deamidase domain-containing protein, partial [Oscillospiraceae bacterium 21-37]
AEDAASDVDGVETDEQSADAQDDATSEAEDAASDVDGVETDEQSADAQDDATFEAEDAVSDLDGTETDEQSADAQDDAAAEVGDTASDVDGAETDEQPADTQDDAVAKAEGISVETDNTDYSADDSSLPGESEWSEDDQQLWDNDFGAVNKDAIDYNDPDYINDGIIKPDWGQESVDTPERTVLPEGTRIVQYSHPDQSGVHFAPEGTEYEDLQLPDSQDKRVENVYEVQEGGLPVDSSEIAVQPWNKTGDSDEGTGAKQFVSDETADTLVEQGKLKPVNDAVSSADDYAGVYGEVPSAADTPQSADLTPAQSLSEYMNKHNYGPDDFAEYSQDPQWRELQKQAYPDYELPPLSEESARSQLSNYMNEHNYGPDDFAEYSQDPQWRELQKQAYPDYELPPRNDADNIGRWSDIPADMSHKENLDAANPNYETGDEWQVNCQRCVPTYEMRSRGYDVTAQPCVDNEDYLAYHPYDVWDGADVRYASGDGITDIQSAMNDWGDGSRAQVCLQWENGDGGHTFMAEQRDGRTHFVDPQTGDEDVSWYFSEARPGTVSFCRTDQLMPSSRILDCCKGAKR